MPTTSGDTRVDRGNACIFAQNCFALRASLSATSRSRRCCSQEYEWILVRASVRQVEILRHNGHVSCHPAFVRFGCRNDVHHVCSTSGSTTQSSGAAYTSNM